MVEKNAFSVSGQEMETQPVKIQLLTPNAATLWKGACKGPSAEFSLLKHPSFPPYSNATVVQVMSKAF